MYLKMKKILSTLFVLIIFSACKTNKDSLVEPMKDLTGTWTIEKVVRNETDITQWLDVSQFKLTLNSDNSYTLENSNIPFVANTNGSWSADDPEYPFHISLQPTDSANVSTADLLSPIEKGGRNIVVTFSPGCNANKYVYTLQRIQ
jgi:hypothetical protein